MIVTREMAHTSTAVQWTTENDPSRQVSQHAVPVVGHWLANKSKSGVMPGLGFVIRFDQLHAPLGCGFISNTPEYRMVCCQYVPSLSCRHSARLLQRRGFDSLLGYLSLPTTGIEKQERCISERLKSIFATWLLPSGHATYSELGLESEKCITVLVSTGGDLEGSRVSNHCSLKPHPGCVLNSVDKSLGSRSRSASYVKGLSLVYPDLTCGFKRPYNGKNC